MSQRKALIASLVITLVLALSAIGIRGAMLDTPNSSADSAGTLTLVEPGSGEFEDDDRYEDSDGAFEDSDDDDAFEAAYDDDDDQDHEDAEDDEDEEDDDDEE